MDTQLYFAEIMPNIYWTYHFTCIKPIQSHKDFIIKLCQTHGIKDLIKVDNSTTYWTRYDMNNQHSDIQQLEHTIKQITSKIKFNYINRIPTLIISIQNNDIALACIAAFFREHTKMDMATIMDALKYKIINMPDISTKVDNYIQIKLRK